MGKILLILFFIAISTEVFAGGRTYVRGYFRKDGTYVAPHYRSAPDGNFFNNWSTYGNINPYTGKIGTKLFPDRYRFHGYIKSNVPGLYLAPVPDQLIKGEYNSTSITAPNISSLGTNSLKMPDEIKRWIKKYAEEQWPNDYNMQAYTIEKQSNGYKRLLDLINDYSKIGIPKDIFKWCLVMSKKQWPNDYSMQAYVFEKNIEGYLKLSALLSSEEWKSLPESVQEAILKESYASWPNDFSMQAYIIEKQIDGFYSILNLQEKLRKLPVKIAKEIEEKAKTAWPKDLSMQAYTIRKEIDGYLRLQNLKNK